MSSLLCVGFVTGSDAAHDVDGARYTVGVTSLGEPHAQHRILGRCFYLKPLTPPCSARMSICQYLRTMLLHRKSGRCPVTDREGIRATVHQAARFETELQPSRDTLLNTSYKPTAWRARDRARRGASLGSRQTRGTTSHSEVPKDIGIALRFWARTSAPRTRQRDQVSSTGTDANRWSQYVPGRDPYQVSLL